MPNAGDKYSRHSYGTVVADNGRMIKLKNEAGLEWNIGRQIFDAEFTLASEFDGEPVHSTQIELIQTIKANQRVAMTVNFNKQVDEDTVVDDVIAISGDVTGMTRKELKKKVKAMLNGEERTLIGRHSGAEDDRGRMRFLAMEDKSGPRLVDPRGVNWAIINGVKYVKK